MWAWRLWPPQSGRRAQARRLPLRPAWFIHSLRLTFPLPRPEPRPPPPALSKMADAAALSSDPSGTSPWARGQPATRLPPEAASDNYKRHWQLGYTDLPLQKGRPGSNSCRRHRSRAPCSQQ
ncbi:hypothetical protein SORBI_3002G175050 [Sorghum bicolor]|uniref:Uncharacterized protein n=1 Tax=Sorghum bicolor TaxID=4558 RepID=A0A1W0W4S2_SORBI|nr:hypothetical protein SORBI_3002G175050 [Sorghum bicolor]